MTHAAPDLDKSNELSIAFPPRSTVRAVQMNIVNGRTVFNRIAWRNAC